MNDNDLKVILEISNPLHLWTSDCCLNCSRYVAIKKMLAEAQIKGIEEAHKEIMESAYAYTGEDELSDFCGVDDLSRVAMSWKVDRIKELERG